MEEEQGRYKAKLIYDDFPGERKILRETKGNIEEIEAFKEKYRKFTGYLQVFITIEYCENCRRK